MARKKSQFELTAYPNIRTIDGAIIPLSVKLRDLDGVTIAFRDKSTGEIVGGKVYLKMVVCGRPGCKKCPHGPYAYAAYRVGKKVKHQYIGIAR